MSDQITVPASIPEASGATRRAFHLAAVYILGALIGLALAIPTALYLLIPPRPRKQSNWIDAGDVSLLPAGSPVEMNFQQSRLDGWKLVTEKRTAWVVREPDNKIVAFAPQCTHLGCAYHWEEKENNFLCPCHTSTFSIDGKVLSGPAPRPLDRLVTKIDQGKILIGTEIQKA